MHRHDTDVTSLVAGLVLVAISLIWVLVEAGALTVSMLPIAVPVVLLVVGLVGLTLAIARTRRDAEVAG